MNRRQMMMAAGAAIAAFQDTAIERVSAAAGATAGRAANEVARDEDFWSEVRHAFTIDRSIIGQNIWFPQEYIPGVSASGRIAPWTYRVGLYSAGAMNRELGEFSGGYFTLGVLGYDFAKKLSVKEAVLTGNYLYQHPDPDNTFTRQLELAREREALRLVRTEVVRHVAHHRVDVRRPDAVQLHEPRAARRATRGRAVRVPGNRRVPPQRRHHRRGHARARVRRGGRARRDRGRGHPRDD